uniref:Uncharacterized protein n=1 Tax=Urocitellus parryii TaxID=9999 RepID=A0A8D2HNX6_UROPR
MNKRDRISHLTYRVQPTLNGHLNPTGDKSAAGLPLPSLAAAIPNPLPQPSTRMPVSNPPQTLQSNSDSPRTPGGWGTQTLAFGNFSGNGSIYEAQEDKNTSRTSLETLPAGSALKCPRHMEETIQCLTKSPERSLKKKKAGPSGTYYEKEEDVQREEEIAKLSNSSLNSRLRAGCTASTEPSSILNPRLFDNYIAIVSSTYRHEYLCDKWLTPKD